MGELSWQNGWVLWYFDVICRFQNDHFSLLFVYSCFKKLHGGKEMKENKKNETEYDKDEIFENFKMVEMTPLPYFSLELMHFPDEIYDFLRKIANDHNCTISQVIEHFMEDLFSETKDISELTPEILEKVSAEKPYLLIKKGERPFARIKFFNEDKVVKKTDK